MGRCGSGATSCAGQRTGAPSCWPPDLCSCGAGTLSATRRFQPCGDETSTAVSLSQQVDEAGGSLNPGTWARVDSSPDNDGAGQHRQMVRVRQARQDGVREKPVAE